MRYVRIRSWHLISITYRSGMIGTRCGRMAAIEGSIAPQGTPIRPTSDRLPLDEKSCESCLRYSAHDQAPDVPNDDATDPGVANDEVTP